MLRQGVACSGAPQPGQHIDGVARAGSAGTKSGSSARSLVLLTMLVPVFENRTRFRDQLQLGDEANLSIIAVCDQSCRTVHLGRPCKMRL